MRFLKFFINKAAFYNIFFVPLQWTHVKTLLLSNEMINKYIN